MNWTEMLNHHGQQAALHTHLGWYWLLIPYSQIWNPVGRPYVSSYIFFDLSLWVAEGSNSLKKLSISYLYILDNAEEREMWLIYMGFWKKLLEKATSLQPLLISMKLLCFKPRMLKFNLWYYLPQNISTLCFPYDAFLKSEVVVL